VQRFFLNCGLLQVASLCRDWIRSWLAGGNCICYYVLLNPIPIPRQFPFSSTFCPFSHLPPHSHRFGNCAQRHAVCSCKAFGLSTYWGVKPNISDTHTFVLGLKLHLHGLDTVADLCWGIRGVCLICIFMCFGRLLLQQLEAGNRRESNKKSE